MMRLIIVMMICILAFPGCTKKASGLVMGDRIDSDKELPIDLPKTEISDLAITLTNQNQNNPELTGSKIYFSDYDIFRHMESDTLYLASKRVSYDLTNSIGELFIVSINNVNYLRKCIDCKFINKKYINHSVRLKYMVTFSQCYDSSKKEVMIIYNFGSNIKTRKVLLKVWK